MSELHVRKEGVVVADESSAWSTRLRRGWRAWSGMMASKRDDMVGLQTAAAPIQLDNRRGEPVLPPRT